MEQITLQGAQPRIKVGSQGDAKESETILKHLQNIHMKHFDYEITGKGNFRNFKAISYLQIS